MKKAQAVILFVIVGIILLISFGIIFFIKNNLSKQETDISTNFETQKVQLASQIQECIRIETKEAVFLYGLNYWSSKEEIEYYIENNLENCVDFEAFENAGLRIEKEDIKANTTISGNYLEVDVNYPITMSNMISSADIENFIYNMEISKEKYIEDGENAVIELKDAGVKLEIAEGTLIEGDNKISIEARGKNIVEAYFDRNVANILYELGPDNARFSKPIKLSIEYDEDIIPEDYIEDDLSIVYFDSDSGKWIELETVLDKKNNIAIANIEHFSVYSLAWIEQYQERFFFDGYDSEFCEDIKNDLLSHLDDIINYALVSPPQGSVDYKYMKSTDIFSDNVSKAISKGTLGIVKLFKGDINDVIDLSSESTRRLFFNRGGNYIDIQNWCLNLPSYKKEYGLGDRFISFCKSSLDYCFRGETFYAPHCEGITSIDHLYWTCRKKASLLERDYSDEVSVEVEGETQTFGLDECLTGGNGMCLSTIRCYDDLHLCYLFSTENPEEQICPEGRVLTINWCPQGDNVRCCKRPEFVEEEVSELKEYDIIVTAYYTPYASQFNWENLEPHVMMQGSMIDRKNNLLLSWTDQGVVYSTLTAEFSRGITSCRTNPTTHRTVAVSYGSIFKCGDKVYIEIPGIIGWDGWYTVEDTGEGLINNQFDIYAGEGEEGRRVATEIGKRGATLKTSKGMIS